MLIGQEIQTLIILRLIFFIRNLCLFIDVHTLVLIVTKIMNEIILVKKSQ